MADGGSGDISLVLCGQAGQGIQTVETLLSRMAARAGYHIFSTKEYMSRVRGGMNSTQIRLSVRPVTAPVARIDVLVALDPEAVSHLRGRLSADTLVLMEPRDDNSGKGDSQGIAIEVPLSDMAKELGSKVYANVIAAGLLAGMVKLPSKVVADVVRSAFASKGDEIVQNNLKAVRQGMDLVGTWPKDRVPHVDLAVDPHVAEQILLRGAEAVGLGALAGGCTFVSSYPMSPSTAVLTFMAQHAREFGIVVEQAEDEIAAINMALGGWYAGARSMVTTSGGGFALMTEGLSLAGMIESPLVIHLAQRPGPATGLPTRTEQADLELALYAGHGEFPRIILAPGNLHEAFECTQQAFNLADRYQVPVFVLTDQYLMDTYYNVDRFDIEACKVESHTVTADADYRRYALTDNGVSPRAVPGKGPGLVVVDSDEHDEDGHITEDLDLRVRMVDKRLRKGQALQESIRPPTLIGPEDYRHLVVCWGSTRQIADEALVALGRKDTAILHLSQVHPLHPDIGRHLAAAENVILLEGNATGQLGKRIHLSFGVQIERRILKYNGLAFTVEEVADRVKAMMD